MMNKKNPLVLLKKLQKAIGEEAALIYDVASDIPSSENSYQQAIKKVVYPVSHFVMTL